MDFLSKHIAVPEKRTLLRSFFMPHRDMLIEKSPGFPGLLEGCDKRKFLVVCLSTRYLLVVL